MMTNEGNSADAPWRTLLNLKSVVLDAGNIVYLKRGSEWNEVFSFNGSGSSGDPILIKPYGSGPRPVIASGGTDCAFLIKNQQYIEVEGLKDHQSGGHSPKGSEGGLHRGRGFRRCKPHSPKRFGDNGCQWSSWRSF